MILLVFIFSCDETKQKQQQVKTEKQKPETVYYCPMHTHVEQDHPGKCPEKECNGMDLILKTSDDLLAQVLKPVNTSVLSAIRTVKPVYKKMNLDIVTNGYIDYDSRTENNISSLYSGRIEKLYIKYSYQPVRKGEKLFEIYSPELVTAQENFLYLLQNDSTDTGLLNAMRQKLKVLGFTDDMLNEIAKTKKAKITVPVYSQYEGHVYTGENMQSSSGRETMEGKPKDGFLRDENLSVKEGMYIMMGETVFNIVNPNKVVALLQIKAEDLSKIKQDAHVEITIDDNPELVMHGKIGLIEPVFKEGSKTTTARVYINNSVHNHRVGNLVKARIKGSELETLWIPTSSLVDLGKEKIVWLKKEESFVARKIETGTIADNMIEVSDGLTEEDAIAMEAHYLIDSEAFIKINYDEE
jgi:Cu(I)/Ag(I) efflux system membrane fusion protein